MEALESLLQVYCLLANTTQIVVPLFTLTEPQKFESHENWQPYHTVLNVTGPAKFNHVNPNYTELYFC